MFSCGFGEHQARARRDFVRFFLKLVSEFCPFLFRLRGFCVSSVVFRVVSQQSRGRVVSFVGYFDVFGSVSHMRFCYFRSTPSFMVSSRVYWYVGYGGRQAILLGGYYLDLEWQRRVVTTRLHVDYPTFCVSTGVRGAPSKVEVHTFGGSYLMRVSQVPLVYRHYGRYRVVSRLCLICVGCVFFYVIGYQCRVGYKAWVFLRFLQCVFCLREDF